MWPVLCGQFLTACFSCCNQGRPHSFSTGPHQACIFSFCPVDMFTISSSSHLNGWIIWLLMTPVIFFTPSFQLACTSWYLVSSRSKCVIAYVCSASAVRTGRARQYFSMYAGCWLMPVKDLVLASRLHIFSNVISLQTPLNWASVWRAAICPYWMPSILSDLV